MPHPSNLRIQAKSVVVGSVGINKIPRVYTYPSIRLVVGENLLPGYSSFYNPLPDLLCSVSEGSLLIPKKLVDIDEYGKARLIIDKEKIGKDGYISKKDWGTLIAYFLDFRYVSFLSGKEYMPETKVGLFMNYIFTRAGVKFDILKEFCGKSYLSGVKGSDTSDRVRMINAGMEGLLYGIVCYEPRKESEAYIDDLIKCVWDWVDKYMKKELINIRGEKYGIAEEMDLNMREMLSGTYKRMKIISKAVNSLEKRAEEVNVETVSREIIDKGFSQSTFGCRDGQSLSIKQSLFKVLNPVRFVSYSECFDNDDDVSLSLAIPIYSTVKEIANTIAYISANDITVATMGNPGSLTIRHIEGYDFLSLFRYELMNALGKEKTNGDKLIFTARIAELVDILFFSDLPLESTKYTDFCDTYKLCRLRAELEFEKKEEYRKAIYNQINKIKSAAYIEIPEVKGEFTIPHYGMISKIPFRGFKNTWINRSSYVLSGIECDRKGISVSGKILAENIDFVRSFVFYIRKRGYLDQNNKNCLMCIRNFYCLEHGFPIGYSGDVPNISNGPTMKDLIEGSEYRKKNDLGHWRSRLKAMNRDKVKIHWGW